MRFLPGNPSYSDDGRCVVYTGDVFEHLAALADESVDLTVTSPPYWGQRDYGTAFWEGGDPHCSHELTGAARTPWANRIKGPNGDRTITGFRETRPARQRGGYCARCGAYRRDYQLGLEQSLGEHIEIMCQVFDEVWRVTKPTGAVFLNYGDSYAAEPNGRSAGATKAAGGDDRTFRDKPFCTVGPVYDPDYGARHDPMRRMADATYEGAGTRRVDHGGRVVGGGVIKPKDLCLIPERLIIALQERGWWVRSRIIWGKKNPMPDSSGRGRPSNAHELIYLLTKSAEADVWVSRDTHELSLKPDLSERCDMPTTRKLDPQTGEETVRQGARWIRLGSYWDASAVQQPSSPNSHARPAQNIEAQQGSTRAYGGTKTNGPMKTVARGHRNNESMDEALKTRDRRKPRAASVAGPPESRSLGRDDNHRGLDKLGQGQGRFVRNYEPAPVIAGAVLPVWNIASEPFKEAHFATFPTALAAVAIAAASPPSDGVVLDPFGGAGTTALAALRLGRRAILIELNASTVEEITKPRLERDAMGPGERTYAIARAAAEKVAVDPGPLFQEAAE